MNDAFVDKQLTKLINQDADFKTKIQAIKEYNILKSRITNKTDVTTGGKPLPILYAIRSNNSAQEDNVNEEADKSVAGGDVSEQDNIDTPLLDRLSAKR